MYTCLHNRQLPSILQSFIMNILPEQSLIVFEPSVFHPLINTETGELVVKRGFQKWRYERDLELFKAKVAESINFCHEKLYETSTQDPHALRFSPWEPTTHENVRKKLLSGNMEVK
ncbi:AKT-interacting protein-like isoform X4 [Tachypleus tridentatus]|uniref:AKT-interacting protein-like isoform X4 n=1 Tax=Tachypleus tridentatus TaxID=6853 RepID=UPI003FD2CAF1